MGYIQCAEEKAQGRSYCCLQMSNGKVMEVWLQLQHYYPHHFLNSNNGILNTHCAVYTIF